MSTTLALLRTELTLLFRDATAWATAIALPLFLGATWATGEPPVGSGLGAVIVLQVAGLLLFTLHTVGVMALAARREQLVLQRWRTSQASTASILGGTLAIHVLLVVFQAAVLTAITAGLAGTGPDDVAMLGLGILAGIAVIGPLTVLVAAFTRSAEHAMITTLPVVVLLTGGVFWVLSRPLLTADLAVLALPGGGALQLLRFGWEGPGEGNGLAALAPALAATAGWTALAAAAAARFFRWGPRR